MTLNLDEEYYLKFTHKGKNTILVEVYRKGHYTSSSTAPTLISSTHANRRTNEDNKIFAKRVLENGVEYGKSVIKSEKEGEELINLIDKFSNDYYR